MILILVVAFYIWVFYWILKSIFHWFEEKEVIQEYAQESIQEPEEPEEPHLTEKYLTLDNYIGQKNNIDYLRKHINKAKKDYIPLPHIILWGSGGLGKSTLIKATAYEMGGKFIEIVPANLRNVKDLFGIFLDKQCVCGRINHYSVNRCSCGENIKINFFPHVRLEDNDIVFLEECHGLKVEIEEALYSLMQDGYMMVRYFGEDKRVSFPKITIAGATTRLGDLNKPFRDRFKISIQLKPYSLEDIETISKMYASSKDLTVSEEALKRISSISFGVPRIAKKYILDSATMADDINIKEVETVLGLLEVDKNGLDDIHRKILSYIHIRGQAGYTAIASSCGITMDIYLEVYEPALVYNEFLWQGSRGRELTEKAKEEYFKNCECKKCEK